MAKAVIKKAQNEILYFVIALLVLIGLSGFVPSVVLMQPKEITVKNGEIIFIRTVTVPHRAEYFHEFENLRTREHLLECYFSGEAFFEWRGLSPVIYKHNCDSLIPGQQYAVRICWSAEWVFGLHLAQWCMASEFSYEG